MKRPLWLLVLLILLGSPLSKAQEAPTRDTAVPAQPPAAIPPSKADDKAASVEATTKQVRESVAIITTTGRDGRREGIGSGFVVAADGLIATNFHVIGDNRAIAVRLADGRQLEVTAVHASNRALDLAVLRVDAHDLKPLALGDSDTLQQGQSVLALGNPQGLTHSVVTGVVSSVREVDGRPMIQLAIPIEPGNSGGPLVDLQGRVQGVMTMKSLVTPNLGFALTINQLKPLLEKPNPIPMARWLTIGALDGREWTPLFGARWRQRAGRITVDGVGQSFGGRSLCLSTAEVPQRPFEVSVAVQLNDESGAAGLAFFADGEHRHYGFYPTNGSLRLTHFDGPDVGSWNILYDRPSRHYVAGDWNTLRVRFEPGRILCFVNDQSVIELADPHNASGKIGLVKFRQTEAQFKHFRMGAEVPRVAVTAAEAEQMGRLAAELPAAGAWDDKLVDSLATQADRAVPALREKAALLEKQAERLRLLASAAHETRVIADLTACVSMPEEKIDLIRAGLLLARLDNDEVDVDAYRDQFERLGRELAAKVPDAATDADKLKILRDFMFADHGFHGSRTDYYHRANSYLNEVLDDREGLPITLSIIYMELAHRIGLNIVGVGLPGHFVVRHEPAGSDAQLIDVFDGATPLTRAEAEHSIAAATEGEAKDEYFATVSKRAILTRMIANLLGVSASDPRAMNRYLNAILALEPDSARHHWLRAVVRYRLEENAGAM